MKMIYSDDVPFWHECEVCGKEEFISANEAFNIGWDYPPHFGQWGVLSARTCPYCQINQTTWWKSVTQKSKDDIHYNSKDMKLIKRIAMDEVDPKYFEKILKHNKTEVDNENTDDIIES